MELAAHEEALLAVGYTRPGPEYDDGTRLVGRRIWVDGHGPALCCEFQRAMVGISSHLVRLENTGTNVELKLERKGNRQLRWLVGPSSTDVAGSSGGAGFSDANLALLHAAPRSLAAIAADVSGQWLCHYCDVDSTTQVAKLLLQQLVVCCSAASRLLSAATPAAVRAELEVALLADRAIGSTSPTEPGERPAVVQAVLHICEQFAKSKASFGGRFSSKETRSRAVQSNTELVASCELVWCASNCVRVRGRSRTD